MLLELFEGRRRFVLRQAAAQDAAREHAHQAAVLDDRNALGVVLLEETESLVQGSSGSSVQSGGSAISPSPVERGSRPAATTSRTSVLRVITPTKRPSSQT